LPVQALHSLGCSCKGCANREAIIDFNSQVIIGKEVTAFFRHGVFGYFQRLFHEFWKRLILWKTPSLFTFQGKWGLPISNSLLQCIRRFLRPGQNQITSHSGVAYLPQSTRLVVVYTTFDLCRKKHVSIF
jgi:hypothetical protein